MSKYQEEADLEKYLKKKEKDIWKKMVLVKLNYLIAMVEDLEKQ